MKQVKIYNIGSLNIDYVYSVEHFVTAGETLASNNMNIFAGGKGLNQSIALAKAGATVIHGSFLGKEGDFLIETLAKAGVDTERIKRTDGSCGHAIIQIDKSGQNCILLFAGANHCLDKNYIEQFLSDAKPNDILLIQNETNALDIIFEIAHAKKMQIAFNPSPYCEEIKKLPLNYVNWWFCNEIEGEALFGSDNPKQIAKNFISLYPESNLILTLGSKGSVFKNKKYYVKQPIYEANVEDTTAAGDTFTGYFLAAVTKGKTAEYALDIASRASSITVSRNGAADSIPYLCEVEEKFR